MEKPRVLILGKLPPPVMGPAIATRILLNSDLKQDYDLHHFDTRINADVADMGSFKWNKISTVKSLYSQFSEMLDQVNPDLVLIPIGQTTAGFLKDIPFIRMASKTSAKVVVQLRGSQFRAWYEKLDILRKNMVRSALEKVDGVIVLGENLRYLFQGLVPDEQIFVVPNGADYRFPESRTQSLRILYLANYLPGKGIKELLEALVIVHEKYKLRFEFHGYGSWDNEKYKSECLKIVERYPNFFLNGNISGDAKWQAFADADMFVFAPKAPEGHPWSTVEAAAAGLPIISTDRGAISQTVVDGENGFLLEHPEQNDLAEKISLLIKDQDLRKKMGKSSRKLYEEKFTAAAMTNHMRRVFQKLLSEACVE
jgi:glycosyltransferase involved in cell wall biosynthesis